MFKRIYLAVHDLRSFIRSEKWVFLTITLTFMISFLAILLLTRYAWAKYQEELYLNEFFYNKNTFSFPYETTQEEKEAVIKEMMETLSAEIKGYVDGFNGTDQVSVNPSELGDKGKFFARLPGFQLSDLDSNEEDFIILSSVEAQRVGYQPGDTIQRNGSSLTIAGIWDAPSTISLQTALRLHVPIPSYVSFQFQKPTSEIQEEAIRNKVGHYFKDIQFLGARLRRAKADYLSQLQRGSVIAFFALSNIIFLLFYWIRKSKYRNAVYLLCGDRVGAVSARILLQVICMTALAYFLALAIYAFTLPLQNLLIAAQHTQAQLPVDQILYVYLIVLAVTVVFLLPALAPLQPKEHLR